MVMTRAPPVPAKSEFLWQEGHTAHETEEEAVAETLPILHDVYADTIENILAIPVLRGRKSESERFPGAVETYTLELARWNKLKALTP
jgi:prolyl-tRNA synthetase